MKTFTDYYSGLVATLWYYTRYVRPAYCRLRYRGFRVGIELSSFYPQDDHLAPRIPFKGVEALVKVGFVPSASLLTKLGGGQGTQLGEMRSLLIGVVVSPEGDIVKWVEIPSEVGRADGIDIIDWQARLEKATQLFQSE